MSTNINSYYAFGRQATRLFQINVRLDGVFTVEHRRMNASGAWETDGAVTQLTAADAAQPVSIKIETPDESWGVVASDPIGWRPRYPNSYMSILGFKGGLFGDDLNWHGITTRAPNARLESEVTFSFQGGVLRLEDPDQRHSTIIDVSKTFAPAGQKPIQCLVLRLNKTNVGKITFGNAKGGPLSYESKP